MSKKVPSARPEFMIVFQFLHDFVEGSLVEATLTNPYCRSLSLLYIPRSYLFVFVFVIPLPRLLQLY